MGDIALFNRRVRVYRNLHKDCYSLQDAKTRRVVGYADFVVLTDAKFKVSQAGRNRVLSENQKNVHATVEGTVSCVGVKETNPEIITKGSVRVRYNPYKYETFVGPDEKPALTASIVALDPEFRMYAWELNR